MMNKIVENYIDLVIHHVHKCKTCYLEQSSSNLVSYKSLGEAQGIQQNIDHANDFITHSLQFLSRVFKFFYCFATSSRLIFISVQLLKPFSVFI